jgi:hypothetical protein
MRPFFINSKRGALQPTKYHTKKQVSRIGRFEIAKPAVTEDAASAKNTTTAAAAAAAAAAPTGKVLRWPSADKRSPF